MTDSVPPDSPTDTPRDGRARDNNVIDFHAWAVSRSRRRHPSSWTPDAPEAVIDDRSPAALWRADFEVHADQHAAASTSGMWVLAPVIDRALRSSLPIFQLGEIGAGAHLLDAAVGVTSENHLQSLRLFIIEHQEHARMLSLVCAALDIEMLDDHWTERAFRKTRYLRGFRQEMLMILIAELITTEIYGTLADGVGDPVLAQLFLRLHTDDLRHLEFHAATLPDHFGRWSTPTRHLVEKTWIVAATAATAAVAWEHRATLRACGSTSRRFIIDTVRAVNAQASRLFTTPALSSSPS